MDEEKKESEERKTPLQLQDEEISKWFSKEANKSFLDLKLEEEERSIQDTGFRQPSVRRIYGPKPY